MKAAWWAARVRVKNPGRMDPGLIRVFRALVSPLIRLMHRPTLEGVERFPAGPFLLVAPHSGGVAASEIFSLLACYVERFGCERPFAPMAHPFGFFVWPIRVFMQGVGAIPSTYEAAEAALSEGVPVLIFPGGDYEAIRPIWQANRVQFGGRKGFLRLAWRAGVPVVPMGIQGSHYSVPILWRSQRVLAWIALVPVFFGVKRYALTVLNVLGMAAIAAVAHGPLGWSLTALLMWVWFASPLPWLPWVPSTIRFRIGEAIAPAELFGGGGSEDEVLARAYRRVEGEVQALVDLGRGQ